MRYRNYRQVASKMSKTKVLEDNAMVQTYIPETQWLNAGSLKNMSDRYPLLFVKPDKGGGGVGVIRIRRISLTLFEVRYRRLQQRVERDGLYEQVWKWMLKGRKYLVQRGIESVSYQGRPFDYRILLQRPAGKWQISGMIAKVAAPGEIVTNSRKGRSALSVEKSLSYFTPSPAYQKLLCEELRDLSFNVASVLEKRYAGLKELGIDLGLDQEGRFWIYEVNTSPQFHIFSHLSNKGTYHLIMKNHRKIISS
ncbi:YheC/YheD family protein [Mechercharimyces sp. CAU 1602]|uniref:YheC/YheD family protein n=1 Tax=Mechercharimyces sp. CAU 1602 TaxID=2973933 RepID=UPI0021629DD1|nr:YheC/YheD family protein [Mechercharimyces sp. CAU 1602]MCS1352657.1 YheC/YheD family protein [Mechercharimyces sp. CAU 1602]